MARTDHPGDVAELHLARTDGPLPDWSAGAHVELGLPSGKVRAYSLSNLPGGGTYRLAVKKEADGTGGSAEVHTLNVGDRLHASRPGNNAPVPEDRSTYHLCAGGIGITVMIPLALRLAGLGKRVALHHSVRDPRHALFHDELRAAGATVHLHLDRAWLDTFLDGAPDDAIVAACGPGGYMDAVRDRALAAGLPPGSYVSEDFGGAGQDRPFTVTLASSGESLTVPPGESIARALGRRGVHVPVSCGYGICGTCTVGVLEGEVDHRDRILDDADRGRKITLCCSRAKGDGITIDI